MVYKFYGWEQANVAPTNNEFEKIENDYSLFKDGDVMRPLPARLCDLENIENYKVQNYAIIPPYWREDNIELCVMPNSINRQEGVE